MYTLIRTLQIRQLLSEQLPSIGGALLIAESFYKFHSFFLECLAFLATWFVIDMCLSYVSGLIKRTTRVDAK
ncbi:MAG: hypothetical protein WBN00_14805 [Sedimenticolaceae bacterium]|jgi:hypothetical protein